MAVNPFTRREFLGACSAGIGGMWLTAPWPGIAEAGRHAARAAAAPGTVPLRTLSAVEAAEIGAMTARILPSDDGPGAREAGVIHFIDRALDTFLKDQRVLVATGLAGLAAAVAQRRPGATRFAGLEPADQDAVLHMIEGGDFFEFVRRGTIAGFLANPSYGGNRDAVGWRWIGFEDRFVWQPPFGYYDREDAVGP